MTLLRQWRISIKRGKNSIIATQSKYLLYFLILPKKTIYLKTLVTTKITNYKQNGMRRGVLCEIFHEIWLAAQEQLKNWILVRSEKLAGQFIIRKEGGSNQVSWR